MIDDVQNYAWLLDDPRAVERVARALALAVEELTEPQRLLWRENTDDVERVAQAMHGTLDASGQRVWDAALALTIRQNSTIGDGRALVRLTLGQVDATSAASMQLVREHTLAVRDGAREEALNGNGGDKLPRRL